MAESVTRWHSFPLGEAASPERAVGWYGGHPRGIRAHEWPRCAVCGAPMCHMAQIDAGPALDLGAFARMSVFICHATGGRCEDWDAWKGANRVILQRSRDDTLYDGPPTVRVYRRFYLEVGEPTDERTVLRKVQDDGHPMAQALDVLAHDKLGGGAVWLQGDATPTSRVGGAPMRLVLQMTTKLVRFDITPNGRAYVFVDPNDPDGALGRLVWQGV